MNVSIKTMVNELFFKGSYNRLDYAENRLAEIYKKFGLDKEAKIDDIKRYFGIDYLIEEVGDGVNGRPDKMVPSIYIPYEDELEDYQKDEADSYDIIKMIMEDIEKMNQIEKELAEKGIKD